MKPGNVADHRIALASVTGDTAEELGDLGAPNWTDAPLHDGAIPLEVVRKEDLNVPIMLLRPTVALTDGEELEILKGLVDQTCDHVPLAVEAVSYEQLARLHVPDELDQL